MDAARLRLLKPSLAPCTAAVGQVRHSSHERKSPFDRATVDHLVQRLHDDTDQNSQTFAIRRSAPQRRNRAHGELCVAIGEVRVAP